MEKVFQFAAELKSQKAFPISSVLVYLSKTFFLISIECNFFGK